MAGGDACVATFSRVAEPTLRAVRTDVPAFTQRKCCFKLPVLAEVLGEGNDPNKNDQHNVLQKYDKNLYTNVVIFLEKYDPTNPAQVDGWYEAQDLSLDGLGTYYPFGSAGMSDTDGKYKYVSSTINWQVVMFTHGEGTYRFKFKETDAFANETESYHFFEFCLKKYLPHRAERTVRFTWYTKGYRGDFQDDLDTWDFVNLAKLLGGDGWFNQMRLPDSWFGDNRSEYEKSYVKYSNRQLNYLKDEQKELYSYHSGMFPSLLHDYIKTDIFQADRLLVTDYNSKNPNPITDKAIKQAGGYEPSWNYLNLNAMVSVDFEQEFQNRVKSRC